jgi:uncharacterized protein YhaN
VKQMVEGVEAKAEQSFRFDESHLQEAEQYLANPRKHAEHHMMFLDESDEHLTEYCDLKDEVDYLRKDVDELTKKVSDLSTLLNELQRINGQFMLYIAP